MMNEPFNQEHEETRLDRASVQAMGNGTYQVTIAPTEQEAKILELAKLHATLAYQERLADTQARNLRWAMDEAVRKVADKYAEHTIEDDVRELAKKLPTHEVHFVPKKKQEKPVFASAFEYIGVVVFMWLLAIVIVQILFPAFLGEKKA